MLMRLCVLILLLLSVSLVATTTAATQKQTPVPSLSDLGLKENNHKGSDGIRRHLNGLLSLAAPDTSALANLDLPKIGLNTTCNNNMCEMLESAMSCKALGFHLSKICAQYMLGFLYECPIFPAPSELFFAPSVCLTELTSLLPEGTLAVQGPPQAFTVDAVSGMELHPADQQDVEGDPVHAVHTASLGALDSLGGAIDPSTFKFTNIKKYLASNFTENCGRRCFQRYIEQANTFYNECSEELLHFVNYTDNTNSVYPLVYITESYQEFRNQVCARNENGTNCFSEVQQFLPDPDNPPLVNIFQYDCNYFDDEGLNEYVLDQICVNFNETGCCFGNQAAMLLQAQTNQSAAPPTSNHHALHMFQPCLMHYLTNQCGYTDPYTFCTSGANANITTIRGSIVMGEITNIRNNPPKMPNVYDVDDVSTLQGVIGFGLLWDNDSPTKLGAMQVEITDFAYFNSTINDQSPATQMTPRDGSLYSTPFTGDFPAAHSARYDFQIVLEGKTKEEGDAFLDAFMNEQVCSTGEGSNSLLSFAYIGAHASCQNVVTEPGLFVADPIIPAPKGAAPRGATFSAALSASLVLAAVVLAGM